MQTVRLNNGVEMPTLGYGVYLVKPDECERCVSDAISVGYRLIDTAQGYYNEEGVGRAIAKCGVPRDQLFITTKAWIFTNADDARRSIEASLRKLGTDYIDLMLVHHPIGDYYATYRALEQAMREGKIRAIGVSNFHPDRFVDIAECMETKPAVNQLRTNVFSQQWDNDKEMRPYGSRIMAWAPLTHNDPELLTNATIRQLSEKYAKTPQQIALRYLIDRGIIAIPKSTHIERMEQNLDVFDFSLSANEIDSLRPLDRPQGINELHRDPELIRFLLNYEKNNKPKE